VREAAKKSLSLRQQLKGNLNKGSLNLDIEDGQDWVIKIDLRSGSGFEAEEYQMPSLFVEASFSNSLDFNADSQIRHFSDTCINSRYPVWNQSLRLEGSLDGTSKIQGSVWLVVYDQARQSAVVDSFSIPVSFLTPF
jgi:hypothetical protein